jgi:hypothetical protein
VIFVIRGPSSLHGEANFAQRPRRFFALANHCETQLLPDRDMSVPGIRDTQT